MPDLDVVTLAAKAAHTQNHIHFWIVELTPPAVREEVLAAFVVGISLVMVFYHPGTDASWLRWFFVSGLAAIIVLGVWLAVAIHQSGRR